MVGKNNVLSADLENVGQGLDYKKSLYLGSYATNFNLLFKKWCSWAVNKSVTSADLHNADQGHMSQINSLTIIYPIWTTCISWMMTPVDGILFYNDDATS